MPTTWTFNGTKTQHDTCRGKGCMKKFCKSLEEHGNKIINFEKNKMIPITGKKLASYASLENCHICKKILRRRCGW